MSQTGNQDAPAQCREDACLSASFLDALRRYMHRHPEKILPLCHDLNMHPHELADLVDISHGEIDRIIALFR